MKARTVISGKKTILDVVRDHPTLNKKQKDELISGYDKYIEKVTTDAVHILLKELDKELTAEVCIVLHNEFGFGKERLKRFAKEFDREMLKIAEIVQREESVCVGAMHDMEYIYPDYRKWFEDENRTN